MTYRELVSWGVKLLSPQGEPLHGLTEAETRQEVQLLLNHFCHLTTAEFLLREQEEVPLEDTVLYRSAIARRRQDEPIAYILGEWEFMGLPMRVTSSTLIPRQDTERLVEVSLDQVQKDLKGWNDPKKPYRILDLCTGSGAIIVSLAVFLHKQFPEQTFEFFGSDISPEALAVASENADRNGVSVMFRRGDLFRAVNGEEPFDLIVSNPPYVSEQEILTLSSEVRDYEPLLALFGGKDGLLFYEKIAAEAGQYLTETGSLLLEIGDTQREAVGKLLQKEQFKEIQAFQDLPGKDRVMLARR